MRDPLVSVYSRSLRLLSRTQNSKCSIFRNLWFVGVTCTHVIYFLCVWQRNNITQTNEDKFYIFLSNLIWIKKWKMLTYEFKFSIYWHRWNTRTHTHTDTHTDTHTHLHHKVLKNPCLKTNRINYVVLSGKLLPIRMNSTKC